MRTSAGNTTVILLIFVGIVSLVTYLRLSASLLDSLPQADLRLEPPQQLVNVGDEFSVTVVVESDVAVNVFAGDLRFDPEVLRIRSIDYNTSIADLWAERPWYSNGEGTMNFAGGTTQPDGFLGEGNLITITFVTQNTGNGNIVIDSARILQHDGLGTDAVLAPSIDSIITINEPDTREVLYTSGPRTSYLITKEERSTDLNGDGKQTIADTSIFMTHLATQNERSDFNEDGVVSLADLSILLESY